MIEFQFRKIHPDAKVPYRKRIGDAGYDLSSICDVEILSHGFVNIPTGLQISAPNGYYYTIESRSGMLRAGIASRRGIIDSTYTGEIYVMLYNYSEMPYLVEKGDRIAQITPHKIIDMNFCEVEEFSPEYSSRGEAGFGSSGR